MQYNCVTDPLSPNFPAGQYTQDPGDELVTLDDGRIYPLKKTICVPHGNKQVLAGKRVKLTAALREAAETDDELLRKAANGGHLENLRELIAKGVNVNNRAMAAGATPMICAALNGKLDAMKLLFEAGADPHLGNGMLSTPISVAAQWGHVDVVRWLLDECNVDPRQWDSSPEPQSPLHHARYLEHKEMEQIIARRWQHLDDLDEKKKLKVRILGTTSALLSVPSLWLALSLPLLAADTRMENTPWHRRTTRQRRGQPTGTASR